MPAKQRLLRVTERRVDQADARSLLSHSLLREGCALFAVLLLNVGVA
jgi:hypothetical protein